MTVIHPTACLWEADYCCWLTGLKAFTHVKAECLDLHGGSVLVLSLTFPFLCATAALSGDSPRVLPFTQVKVREQRRGESAFLGATRPSCPRAAAPLPSAPGEGEQKVGVCWLCAPSAGAHATRRCCCQETEPLLRPE